MVINNLHKSKIKILLDTEDLKSFDISLNMWLISPIRKFRKIICKFSRI